MKNKIKLFLTISDQQATCLLTDHIRNWNGEGPSARSNVHSLDFALCTLHQSETDCQDRRHVECPRLVLIQDTRLCFHAEQYKKPKEQLLKLNWMRTEPFLLISLS